MLETRFVDLEKLLEVFPKINQLQQRHDKLHPHCTEGFATFRHERFARGDSEFELCMSCHCEVGPGTILHLGVGERTPDAAAPASSEVYTANALGVLSCIASGGTLQTLNNQLAGLGLPSMHQGVWEREEKLWHHIALKILREECDRNILYEAAASSRLHQWVTDRDNNQQIALEVSVDGMVSVVLHYALVRSNDEVG